MKSFSTSTTIHAHLETIWALLTDAVNYPKWNTTVEKIDGKIAAQSKITVHAKNVPGRGFSLRVSEFAPPRRMVWSGGMPLGLFVAARSFVLTPAANGDVEFEMVESYSGLLAPLISKSIPDLQPSFATFAADLKGRAESMSESI